MIMIIMIIIMTTTIKYLAQHICEGKGHVSFTGSTHCPTGIGSDRLPLTETVNHLGLVTKGGYV